MNKTYLIAVLEDVIAELKGDDQEPEVQDGKYTKEEIGQMVYGNPFLYLDEPEKYEAMKPYADPDRIPFSDSTWFTFRMQGKKRDPRGYSSVEVEGKVYHRMAPKSADQEFYWIGKGVVDVTQKPLWLFPADVPMPASSSPEAIENVRNYKGGITTDPNTWPRYGDIYLESH